MLHRSKLLYAFRKPCCASDSQAGICQDISWGAHMPRQNMHRFSPQATFARCVHIFRMTAYVCERRSETAAFSGESGYTCRGNPFAC